jgi:hypothetical protein
VLSHSSGICGPLAAAGRAKAAEKGGARVKTLLISPVCEATRSLRQGQASLSNLTKLFRLHIVRDVEAAAGGQRDSESFHGSREERYPDEPGHH